MVLIHIWMHTFPCLGRVDAVALLLSSPSPTTRTQLDKSEVSTLSVPSTTSHGGSDTNISADCVAAVSGVATSGAECPGPGEPQRTRAALDHLQQKILKVTEQIRVEQEARDDNVAEYLKLAHNADKQQASRIKQVFEKKNQKSAQTIAHLHKKLEHYHKKLKEIEQVGARVVMVTSICHSYTLICFPSFSSCHRTGQPGSPRMSCGTCSRD